MIIDVHSHFFPDRFLRSLEREGPAHGVRAEERDGVRVLWTAPHQFARIGPVFYDVPTRLEALDRWGITVEALSLSPPMLHWAPPLLARELAALFNDELVAVCRSYPDRFVALATLPLQDVAAAVAEAERAARAGCRGLYVGTNVNGRYLDSPEFTPLFDCAVRLGLPMFTHPLNNAGQDRMSQWYLDNSVGNPGETALLAARLIMSGILDRFPKLRIVLAHGGGTLAFLAGRMDHAYCVRRESQAVTPKPPSTYLRHFFVDTITHGDRMLRFLIDAIGPAQILLGSDHPYDMADPDPVGRLRRLELPAADLVAIGEQNAVRLLGLGQVS